MMILQEIISKFVWTPYGIQCPDYSTMKLAHKFLREAILDRHLYVCKVIGFEIKSTNTSRAHTGTYIARHKQIGESYPEIMLNLQDKVFLTSSNSDLTVALNTGENTINNVAFINTDKEIVPVIYERADICRVIDKTCTLHLKVIYDCGYRNYQQNSKKIGTDYFPCCTDFFVGEYFRILPPEPIAPFINIRYFKGATPELLKQMLTRYWMTIQSGGLRKDEREWLRSFMQ